LKNSPLVSIVTPVYNGDKYIAQCIESVLAQSYPNWEYVIVDNCSNDDTLAITNSYLKKDARIRIHRNEQFLDLMPNWNHALRQISPDSKYCKIVHADDWLFPECIQRMVALAERYPTAGIVSAYRVDENQVNLDGLSPDIEFLPGREACRQFFLNRVYLFGSPSSLLFRSDLIRGRDPFYNQENIHADQEVCFDLLRSCDLAFVHQVLTYTRRHNEANTTRTRYFQTFLLGNLLVLHRYGKDFLNDAEFSSVSERFLKVYYRVVGKFVWGLRKKANRPHANEFLSFHRDYLRKIGLSLSWWRLMSASMVVFYNRWVDKAKIK
jgi:glycosyltransferase involved in cell wall biosynthesis